jgi:hypothetical protein
MTKPELVKLCDHLKQENQKLIRARATLTAEIERLTLALRCRSDGSVWGWLRELWPYKAGKKATEEIEQ